MTTAAIKAEEPKLPDCRCYKPFAVAAWVLFATSLLLPAHAYAGFGWNCALLALSGWPKAFSIKSVGEVHILALTLPNLFMILSPFLLLRRECRPSTFRWLRICASLSVLLTASFILWFASGGIEDFRIGYFVWVFSFGLLGMSLFKPV